MKGTRPSEIYCVAEYEGDPVAFWFDNAVSSFGRMVEHDIEKHCRKAKSENDAERMAHTRLMKWLDFDETMTDQRFAKAPAGRVKTVRKAPDEDQTTERGGE